MRRELVGRLDPWSYWVVDLGHELPADLAVVGTTGAFGILVDGREGYLEADGGKLSVDRRPISGFRDAKTAAKRLRSRLGQAAVYTEVVPMICLSRAVAGASRTIRGVRVVRLQDLAGEIAGREKSLSANRARRGAEALGSVVATGQGARPEVEDPEHH
ncbi:MAG TPA: hypothetical protein VE646_08935 [Actinomycetota bacterium]|nr:hypothetical protein [Actinomycetota bacterium]